MIEKFRDPRKLSPEDAKQIPKWLRHFFIYALKPMATALASWIDQMKEATKEPSSDWRYYVKLL